jgi:hypothetical protein
LTARFVYLKDVPSKTPLGFTEAFHTRRPSRIAMVPVGYADGLNRALSNRGHAIVAVFILFDDHSGLPDLALGCDFFHAWIIAYLRAQPRNGFTARTVP